ncbi:MAG: methyltransferase domain-containing protein [Terrimicrobiaceae bacterium]|jgi:SAM-dependent methyltransferase
MEKPEVEFDQYAAQYEDLRKDALVSALGGDGASYFYRNKVRWIQENLKTLNYPLRGSLKVLDYGCGRGDLLATLKRESSGWEIAGADISGEMLARASLKSQLLNGCSLFILDETSKLEHSEKYDLVLLVCVLHHVALPSRRSVIRDASAYLRKGGTLMVFEHNPLNPLTRAVVKKCPFDRDAILLPSQEVCELLRAGGFSVKLTRHIVNIPPRFISRFWFFEKLFSGLPFGGQYTVAGAKL